MNLVIVTPPSGTVVDLDTAKNFLRVTTSQDDLLIPILIQAATEAVEVFTGRSVATKTYRQGLDQFPAFVDSAISQLAYPPAYYSLPLYSTAMWNYSQMIKLFAPPLIAVLSIKYTDTDGNVQTLDPSQYVVDSDSEPARIFPAPGLSWPGNAYVPNSVEIEFTAGFNTDPSSAQNIPNALYLAILMMTAHYYENRGEMKAEMPASIQQLLYSQRVMDVAPSRG